MIETWSLGAAPESLGSPFSERRYSATQRRNNRGASVITSVSLGAGAGERAARDAVPCDAGIRDMGACDGGGLVEFLGFSFDTIEPAAAMKSILARNPRESFAYVITPNVDHVVRLQCARSDLWPAYRHAWLTLCDSRILAKLAASARVDLPVTTGSDLTASMFKSAIARDDRIAVLGGDAEMIETIRKRRGFSNLIHYNPPMGFIHDPLQKLLAVDFVVNAKARFTFIAVGSPQQEILAYEVARTGEAVGVGLCIGASLEFIAGKKARAPRVFQALSMEWLFRLATDPARLWRRYLVDGPIIFSIFRRWQRLVRPGRRAAS